MDTKCFKTIITAKHLIHIIKQHKVKYQRIQRRQRSIGQRQTKHNYSKASNTNHKKGMLRSGHGNNGNGKGKH
jgi:hypothetical protein